MSLEFNKNEFEAKLDHLRGWHDKSAAVVSREFYLAIVNVLCEYNTLKISLDKVELNALSRRAIQTLQSTGPR